MKKRNHSCFIVLLMIFMAGCMPKFSAYKATQAKEANVFVYLQPLPQEAQLLNFTFSNLFAVRQDDSRFPLGLLFNELKGSSLVPDQKALASALLPPGRYKGFFLQIKEATLLGEEGEVALLVPAEELFVEHVFTVIGGMNRTFVLSLSPEKIVSGGFQFTPSFLLIRPNRQLINLKGFASSSGANSIVVFNKSTMEVVDRIRCGEEPKGLALDQRRGWLYIALAGEDAIEVVEVANGEIQGKIRLVLGDRPVELALSPDGGTLVSANYGSNTMSIINTASLFEEGRINLASEPTSVIFSQTNSRAFVAQSFESALSAINLDTQKIESVYNLEESPLRAVLSKDGRKVCIITGFSSDLLVADLHNFSRAGRVFVGSGARTLIVDSATGLAYIGKKSGEIVVVDVSALAVIDSFFVNGDAASLTIDNEENSFFAVLSDKNKIQKFDLVGKKALGEIEIGEGGYEVVVMGER